MSHTTRFLFPEDPAQARAVFEARSALVPDISHTPGGAGTLSRASGSTSLPPVSRSKQQQVQSSRSGLSGWSPMVTGSEGINLAHYKHYDVQLDWCEVRCRRLRCPSCSIFGE